MHTNNIVSRVKFSHGIIKSIGIFFYEIKIIVQRISNVLKNICDPDNLFQYAHVPFQPLCIVQNKFISFIIFEAFIVWRNARTSFRVTTASFVDLFRELKCSRKLEFSILINFRNVKVLHDIFEIYTVKVLYDISQIYTLYNASSSCFL